VPGRTLTQYPNTMGNDSDNLKHKFEPFQLRSMSVPDTNLSTIMTGGTMGNKNGVTH